MKDASGRELRIASSRFVVVSAGVVVALMLSCGPGESADAAGADASDARSASTPGPDPHPSTMPDPDDSLLLRLEAPDTVPAGDPVPFALRAENRSGATLTLYLTGREIAFDVVVLTESGDTVWRRLEGEVIPAMLRVETLEAGGALLLETTWDQRTADGAAASPGRYRVHGEILTEGAPLRSPAVELRIRPP
jgi:hypothetical protein